ncbi:MAG: type I glyceraldehyde-3-phosphate dehydrogenase [Myxococcota bacterium]
MVARIGINGFGRIGRCALRAALDDPGLEFVAINDLTDAATLAHLFEFDSVHGRVSQSVSASDGALSVGPRTIRVLSERDPAALPWGDLGVDIVIESTGLFTRRADAAKHLAGGARKVILSAPAPDPDVTLAMGVNEERYDPDRHQVISNASCTTNCLAPVAKVMHRELGIRRGWMTTIHAYTNDQRILDLPHKDLRRARAAGVSMIPTSTGAARAVSLVLPELEGKLDGIAIRVPTADVSIVDLVAETERQTDAETVNEAFRKEAEGAMKGILAVSDRPLVSIDYRGDAHSATVDAPNTSVLEGNLVKVLAWYDNEWGYANRVVDLARWVSRQL